MPVAPAACPRGRRRAPGAAAALAALAAAAGGPAAAAASALAAGVARRQRRGGPAARRRASLVEKLRKKADREKPALRDFGAAGAAAGDFDLLDMTPSDAADMNDLQLEWFPEESYPDGVPWCERLLAHDGVVAIKACLPDDPQRMAMGFAVVLCTRGAMEDFLMKPTVDTLRQELTCKYYIPFDAPSRRELGYVLSVGLVGELRGRGLAAALLRRALGEAQARAPEGVRAFALDVADYNAAAVRYYEREGFRFVKEQPDTYAGDGRRTHSANLYAKLVDVPQG
ncbi:unnamed protein product [Prorocentrum cordatum]|uniref:N-acetyltransferase domain-containing protein n=1 Tax=Prorocentrum cordatum TaxID=2364126 RepID=A0ABN9UN23_9DINO|nr:unnamed protein product [Polarella glacialis]